MICLRATTLAALRADGKICAGSLHRPMTGPDRDLFPNRSSRLAGISRDISRLPLIGADWAGDDRRSLRTRPRQHRNATVASNRWIDFASELEAHADGRVDGVFVQEATRESVRDARVHGAGVSVETLGEPVIDQEGDGIELSAACRRRGVRAADQAKAVLLFVVIGADQIDIGPYGVFRARPEHLQILGIRKGGVADGAERIAADDGRADWQRNRWIDEPDGLVTGIELHRTDAVAGE